MNTQIKDFILNYLENDSATICLIIGNDNIIKYANSYAEQITDKKLNGKNIDEIFIDFNSPPSVEKYLASKNKKKLINIKTYSSIPVTYYFRFTKINSEIIAIGEANNEEMIMLKKNMLELNQDLNNLSRELNKKNAELSKLNEQKNRLLGVAAHDLRNPISIIIGYTDFLLEDMNERLTETQVRILKIIQKSSEFMLNLLNELLDISKIESGKLTLHKKKSNILHLIKKNIEINQSIAAKKSISIQMEVYETIPEIMIDELKIEQVLNNLINNAIKFSFPQTNIIISVLKYANQINIAVKDQGQGIPEDELNKLFLPFETTSTKSTDGEKSTGLGLAIVNNIILGHQGKIWVESKLGKGTTFYFSLPIDNK